MFTPDLDPRLPGELTEAELALPNQLPPGADPPPHKWRWPFSRQFDPRVHSESVDSLQWEASGRTARIPKDRLKSRSRNRRLTEENDDHAPQP
jgi:hypothetical protein